MAAVGFGVLMIVLFLVGLGSLASTATIAVWTAGPAILGIIVVGALCFIVGPAAIGAILVVVFLLGFVVLSFYVIIRDIVRWWRRPRTTAG
jgi:hypothetical protein